MKNDQEVIPRYPFQPTLKIGGFEGPLDLLVTLNSSVKDGYL